MEAKEGTEETEMIEETEEIDDAMMLVTPWTATVGWFSEHTMICMGEWAIGSLRVMVGNYL